MNKPPVNTTQYPIGSTVAIPKIDVAAVRPTGASNAEKYTQDDLMELIKLENKGVVLAPESRAAIRNYLIS